MVEEVLGRLGPIGAGLVVDGTVGAGGHARALLDRYPGIDLLGIDRDPEALDLARAVLASHASRVTLERGSYGELPEILGRLGLGRPAGILLDLGASSIQLDRPERGFGFRHEESPLDMRMDPDDPVTAADLIERSSDGELEEILRAYGEEPAARRIVRAIRRAGRIRTVGDLVRAVAGAAGGPRGRIHPATRTFQALRIAVNRELEPLDRLLSGIDRVLGAAGRIAVLSYHSLEDRIVKQRFLAGERDGRLRLFSRSASRPSAGEVRANPRARSARLRAAEAVF
ncbi:MAG: 16S rRNA (cytosine(1402)-N(4))-methyltransferase RsmH [Planctomycetes bacterium]|nr:16S rRNA (cytosine(1402)-N(4))-methyltransferase RsmH [Planctomycetota bacterium]